jgi:hypothetical protein
MAHQPSSLARAEWGTPVVNSTAERDALFPNPVANQRVQNLQTQAIERWVGGWIPDIQYPGAAVGDTTPVVATTAARDAKFPTPATNQRVQNLQTCALERWNGTAWVADNIVTVNAAAYGFSPTASAAANRAAINAAYAALAGANVGTIELPEGTFTVDVDTADGCLRILRDNLTIRGQGIGKTILQYTGVSDGSYGNGSPFVINVSPASVVRDFIAFEGITFHDLRTTSFAWVGHLPAAIDGLLVRSFRCSRCEFVNIKGNGCVTVLGDAPDNTHPGTGDFILEDCIFRGDAAGGYVQRDGFNCSAMGRAYVRRNRLAGGLGYGSAGAGDGGIFYEGGGGIGEFYFYDNVVDQGGIGLGGIAALTILGQAHIRGNSFLNWSNNGGAVQLTPDTSSFPVSRVVIEHNRFISASNQAAIGVVDGVNTDVLIQQNHFECAVPINMAKIPQGITRITKNTAKWTANGNIFVSAISNPAFVNAGDVLEISHNTLLGRTDLEVVSFPSWPNLKDRRVRGLHTNILQVSYTGGQIDASTVGAVTLGADVAQGADSPLNTVTVQGALVGDLVRCAPRWDGYDPVPAGVAFFGQVTAADTVTWWFRNNSGGTIGTGTTVACMITVERT